MTAKISLCLIVRNESSTLEQNLRKIRPFVSEICIVDTGSTDNTPDIAKRYADKFESYTGCNDSNGKILDFSDARTRSFKLATQPWVMWMDGDDEIRDIENISSVLEKYESDRQNGPVTIMFPYEYSHDSTGKCTCLHYRERIVSPFESFKWTNWVHEVIIPINSSQQFKNDSMTWVHHRDKSNKPIEPGRNLRILKSMYEKFGESDARHLYYLGIEYGNNGDIANSLRFLKRYFELSGWDEEKYMACLDICKHHISRGEYDDAMAWGLKATLVRENWGEAYFVIAKCCYFLAQRGTDPKRNWDRCIHFAKLGLSLPPTNTVLFINPLERTYEIHKYLNVALNAVGDVVGALESCRSGLSVQEDGSLRLNEKTYEKFLLIQGAQHAANKLYDSGSISKEARDLSVSLLNGSMTVDSLKETKHAKEIEEAKEENFELYKMDLKPSTFINKHRDIIVYVGSGVEKWNPDTARKSGLGGSETAVIEMAKRFKSKGHRVRVYGNCDGMEGIFDGVEYYDHTKYKNLQCDVLITSRRPQAVDDEFNVRYKVSFCWVHDIHCGSELTHQRALRINKFFCLSNWHKDFFLSQHECVHPDQVIVTRNGIDLSRFKKDVVRNPKRAVYSSSPDRGMEVAVAIWPRVRERVPGAELHVFYGFQTWEACADKDQKHLIGKLKQMLVDYETAGVVSHGRVSQEELAEEYLKSGVWTYPTWFSETSCISAMEAHAAGLRMVTSPIAALNETVGPRGSMIHGDWLSIGYQDAFINSVVDAMTKTDNSDRRLNMKYAENNFSWDGVAADWDGMFDGVMDEFNLNLMPPYKGVKR